MHFPISSVRNIWTAPGHVQEIADLVGKSLDGGDLPDRQDTPQEPPTRKLRVVKGVGSREDV